MIIVIVTTIILHGPNRVARHTAQRRVAKERCDGVQRVCAALGEETAACARA